MAFTPAQKTGLWIIGTIAVLAVVVILYFAFKKDAPCDPNRNGFDVKGNPKPKCQVADPNTTNTPGPPNSQWVSDANFPIKRWSWGPKVLALQKALGVGQDGRFGSVTEAALQKKTGKTQISTQAEYNAIVSPAPPQATGGTNFEQLKKNLGSKATPIVDFGGGLKSTVSGKNKKYDFLFFAGNGRFFVREANIPGELAKGTYVDGGSEMYVDGGDSYGTIIPRTVFSNMNSIVSDIE